MSRRPRRRTDRASFAADAAARSWPPPPARDLGRDVVARQADVLQRRFRPARRAPAGRARGRARWRRRARTRAMRRWPPGGEVDGHGRVLRFLARRVEEVPVAAWARWRRPEGKGVRSGHRGCASFTRRRARTARRRRWARCCPRRNLSRTRRRRRPRPRGAARPATGATVPRAGAGARRAAEVDVERAVASVEGGDAGDPRSLAERAWSPPSVGVVREAPSAGRRSAPALLRPRRSRGRYRRAAIAVAAARGARYSTIGLPSTLPTTVATRPAPASPLALPL